MAFPCHGTGHAVTAHLAWLKWRLSACKCFIDESRVKGILTVQVVCVVTVQPEGPRVVELCRWASRGRWTRGSSWGKRLERWCRSFWPGPRSAGVCRRNPIQEANLQTPALHPSLLQFLLSGKVHNFGKANPAAPAPPPETKKSEQTLSSRSHWQ